MTAIFTMQRNVEPRLYNCDSLFVDSIYWANIKSEQLKTGRPNNYTFSRKLLRVT